MTTFGLSYTGVCFVGGIAVYWDIGNVTGEEQRRDQEDSNGSLL